jgi:hypothetical protein
VWSGGLVGLFKGAESTATVQFDDLKVGYDDNADGDILDAGDYIQIDDDFSSTTLSLTYDNNGNLTDDGVLKYVYDAWNRLVKAKRRVDAETVVAAYGYYADVRRSRKVVQLRGVETVANDGGNTTIDFYYDDQWRPVEERNGSNQAVRQYLFGTQYTDEPILVDVNSVPGTDNDCNPDVTTTPETNASDPADQRYFYHQDRNWNVVALTAHDPNAQNAANGRVVERYGYTPYGEVAVLRGDGGSGELGGVRLMSSVGSVFAHQGLPLDREKGSYQNRFRELASTRSRFMTRDPVTQRSFMTLSAYRRAIRAAFMTPSVPVTTYVRAAGTVGRHA